MPLVILIVLGIAVAMGACMLAFLIGRGTHMDGQGRWRL